MVDYSNYPIFLLINILWGNSKDIYDLNELISIDNQANYRKQRSICYDCVNEVRIELRNKWLPLLAPLLPLFIRFQNQKIAYSPKRHSRESYMIFLNSKRHTLVRHQELINQYDLQRSRRRRTTVATTTRGCLRQ